VVHDQVQATTVRLWRPVLVVDARIEQSVRSTADAELVVRFGQEVGACSLPLRRLIPSTPFLLVTLTIVFTLPIFDSG